MLEKSGDESAWQILGASDNGELLITRRDAITAMEVDETGYVNLGKDLKSGEKSMHDYVNTFNAACTAYNNEEKGAVKARALNTNDVDNLSKFVKSSYVYGTSDTRISGLIENPIESYGTVVNFIWGDDTTKPMVQYGNSEPALLTSAHNDGFYGYNSATGKLYPIAHGESIPSITNYFYSYYLKDYFDDDVYSKLFPTGNYRLFLPDIVVKPEADDISYALKVLEYYNSWGDVGILLKSYSISKSKYSEWNSSSAIKVKPVVHLKADLQLKEGTTTDWSIDL